MNSRIIFWFITIFGYFVVILKYKDSEHGTP